MPRRTEAEARETRNRILDKAIAIMAEQGYEHLSLEQLAADCDVTRGAVYHHFQSKEGLFRAAIEKLLREMGDIILKAADSGPSRGSDQWEALLLGTRAFMEESQTAEYQRIILADAPSVLGFREWQKLDDKYTTSTLTDVFSELLPSTRKKSVLPLAVGFSGAMNQLSRWVRNSKDIELAYSTLIRMFSGVLEWAGIEKKHSETRDDRT